MPRNRVNIAALHLSGWYDIFTQDTIDAFVAYQELGGPNARGKQKLIVGPWTHQNLGEEGQQGELSYPFDSFTAPVSRFSVWAALLSEQFELKKPLSLGDAVVEFGEIPAIQYFVMGDVDDPQAPGNEWRSADSWPPESEPVTWYLAEDGKLSPACPSGGETSYTFDPSDPAPTVCGNNLFAKAGPCDQREVESRNDTVSFSTSILKEPLEVTGQTRARLFLDLDQVDADLVVKLTDVYPDGRSMLVTEGVTRIAKRNGATGLDLVEAHELVAVEVLLPSTSLIFNKGHRLRITISSSNSPKFQVNPGNGKEYGEFGGEPREPFEVRLHHSTTAASYVELPLPAGHDLEASACD